MIRWELIIWHTSEQLHVGVIRPLFQVNFFQYGVNRNNTWKLARLITQYRNISLYCVISLANFRVHVLFNLLLIRSSTARGSGTSILLRSSLQKLTSIGIGHFQVPLCLCFKVSPSVKPFSRKWLWFAWKWNCMLNSFSCEKFRVRLILKQRQKRTQKWPTVFKGWRCDKRLIYNRLTPKETHCFSWGWNTNLDK